MRYRYSMTFQARTLVDPPLTLRFESVDALRGLAMVWMTVFHFCFDLNHFGYLTLDFYTDPFWTWQRSLIVSLFLFTAGLGQAIAVHQGQCWPRFWRRWAQVAGGALLVSAGSYWMYPTTFIYFGVLHGVAVMLIIVRLTAGWGGWLWLCGLIAISSKFIAPYALGTGATAELFNTMALNWLGWVSRNPVTEDYVPLIPWLGVMWWGIAAGQWLLCRQSFKLAEPFVKSGHILPRLALLGRWSLSYYIFHQPVLIGSLMALAWLRL